jgi:hypothetical protein
MLTARQDERESASPGGSRRARRADKGAARPLAPPVVQRGRRCTVPECCLGATRCSRPCIPTELRRAGRVLLNQQCWLWGQDIRRPEGNAPIEYGFARTKPPEGQKGSNTYLLHRPDGVTVILWAFGFFYHQEGAGGIFIPRFAFAPRLARVDALPVGVWSATQLGYCRPPRDAREWACAADLFIPALRWVADYERWIRGARSLAYRDDCVGAWKQAQVAADCLAERWDALADACHAAMRAFIAARA